MPENKDHWWQINDTTSLPDLINEVIDLLTSVAFPEIFRNISDASLEENWLKGLSSGLSEPQMYLYLIALLKQKNSNLLPLKVDKLKALSRGKPFQQNVNESLKEL